MRSPKISLLKLFILTAAWHSVWVNGAPQSKKATKIKATPVVTAQAHIQQLAPTSWVSGTVISRRDARLATEVEGRIIKIADVGKRVKKGGAIAQIDDTIVKLKIQELQAGVNKEKAQLQFLRQEVDRLKKLAKQNNAAKTQLEQTQADAEVADNNLHIAVARLDLAREELLRHVVNAPFAGVIAERFARLGERASIGREVVRLIDPSTLEVQARAPLTTLNFISEKSVLSLSGGKKQIKGKVRTIVPVGDERSRLLDLRIAVAPGTWRVGQPVRIALPTKEAKEALVVPRDALVMRRDGIFVFRVLKDRTAEKVAVELGSAAGDLVEIKGEIKSGDRVVIRGGERLRPGQKVEVIENKSTKL